MAAPPKYGGSRARQKQARQPRWKVSRRIGGKPGRVGLAVGVVAAAGRRRNGLGARLIRAKPPDALRATMVSITAGTASVCPKLGGRPPDVLGGHHMRRAPSIGPLSAP